jgi:predicted short-subunit dehydrogenase-like oxidoreductase (DUF2520 family)
MARYNLSFAGAGRVAGALCREMHHAGYNILQVVSRSESNGKPLADSCNAEWSSDPDFKDANDIIIVAVPDLSLREVLSRIKCSDTTIVVHTAGSFGLEVFPEKIKKAGVFYPLQTFTQGRKVSFKDLPFLLESSSHVIDKKLARIATTLGGQAHLVDTEKRRMIHLSAVFVCNFSNFMLTAGKELSSKAGLPFGILVPLIKETISKAIEIGPEKSQTGPAIRNDRNTIEKHLELLSFSPELQSIYRDVTQAIIKYFKEDQ